MNSRVWALGLKDHIELRRSAKPPRVKVTKVVKHYPAEDRLRPGRHMQFNWPHGRYENREDLYHYHVPAHQTIIRVCDFIGGRFLRSIKKCRKKGFPKVPLGKVVELPDDVAARLLS